MKKICLMLLMAVTMLCSCSNEPRPTDPGAYKALQELKEKYLTLMYGEWQNEMPREDGQLKSVVNLKLNEDKSFTLVESTLTPGNNGEWTSAHEYTSEGTWSLRVVRDDNDELRPILYLKERQEGGTVGRMVDFMNVDNDVLHIDLYPFSELKRVE